jgi:hypothetical protein
MKSAPSRDAVALEVLRGLLDAARLKRARDILQPAPQAAAPEDEALNDDDVRALVVVASEGDEGDKKDEEEDVGEKEE